MSSRGPAPQDSTLFNDDALPSLQQAVHDLSWLYSHGYAPDSALKLVGDRHALTSRQRLAVRRCSCSDLAKYHRLSHQLHRIEGNPLLVDGFNLLVTVEVALSGGILLLGRDGCLRDLASVHGAWRKVQNTQQALLLLGQTLASLKPEKVLWLLDRPVSNSARLATLMKSMAQDHGWPWQVELDFDPDACLRKSNHPIATADGAILDASQAWLNLTELVVDQVPSTWIVDLNPRSRQPSESEEASG